MKEVGAMPEHVLDHVDGKGSFSRRSPLVGEKTEYHSLLLIYAIAFFEWSLVVCSVAGPVRHCGSRVDNRVLPAL